MKLSIITINYNNKAGLQKTIDSVICQTWKDYEWIIIDGGSTDGSKELIEQYQQHFAYWCSEPDKGVYNAMNKGIAKAKGEYVNFMNSGDCFASPFVLSELASHLHSYDIIFGRSRNNVTKMVTNPVMMKEKLDIDDFFFSTLPHQSCFIRLQLFNQCGFYREDLAVVSDWVFFVQAIVFNGATYLFFPIDVCLFDCGGISSTQLAYCERQKMIDVLFPSMIKDALHSVMSLKTIQRFWVTKSVYSFLYRISDFCSRHFLKETFY